MIRKILLAFLAALAIAGVGLAVVALSENPEKRELNDAAQVGDEGNGE